MPSKSKNLPHTWEIFIKLVAQKPESPVAILIPGFLKSFNEEMKKTDIDKQQVRDTYRAIMVLRLTEI